MNGKIEMWVDGVPVDARTLCYVNPGYPVPVQPDRPCCEKWQRAYDFVSLSEAHHDNGERTRQTCGNCYFFHNEVDR